MESELASTPLHPWHAAHGAKLVDFAGWSMPVQYTSIVAEHMATRQAVGLFDVSHMGRFRFSGPAAMRFLNGLLTRRTDNLNVGKIRYSLVTNERGGILDDVLVSHLQDNPAVYYLVVNASNRQKLLDWFRPRIGAYDVTVEDETCDTAMIAVQGPRGMQFADELFGTSGVASKNKPSQLSYYSCATFAWRGRTVLVSRTGYTGEDGIECIVPADVSLGLWEALVAASSKVGGMAAGLGARDTLRLEAGMPLYGHELSETINPLQAGLGFAVNLADRTFPGHNVLAAEARPPVTGGANVASNSSHAIRIGLVMEGKRVPRENYPILHAGSPVGFVTSGTFSPTLQQPIAMGYVEAKFAVIGTWLNIDLKGRSVEARVTGLPFYQRKSS